MRFTRIALAMMVSGSVCAQTPAAATATPPTDEVLIEWEGNKITRHDFEADMFRIPEINQHDYRVEIKRINEMLENIRLHRSLADLARQAGFDKDPIIQHDMQLAMERQLSTRYMAEYKKNIKVPDFSQAALEHYTANPAEYSQPESVSASHILIRAQKRTDDEARKLAGELLEKIKGGADFEALAVEMSDEPSAKKSKGSVGTFSRGKMVKEFDEAAFAMTQPGQISEVVKTRFGYHIIRYNGRKPAQVTPFDDVKASIVAKLSSKYVGARMTDLVAAIRQNPSVKRHEAAIEGLKTEPLLTQAMQKGELGKAIDK